MHANVHMHVLIALAWRSCQEYCGGPSIRPLGLIYDKALACVNILYRLAVASCDILVVPCVFGRLSVYHCIRDDYHKYMYVHA